MFSGGREEDQDGVDEDYMLATDAQGQPTGTDGDGASHVAGAGDADERGGEGFPCEFAAVHEMSADQQKLMCKHALSLWWLKLRRHDCPFPKLAATLDIGE